MKNESNKLTGFAVREAILKIKVTIAEKWSAVSTGEALGMELLANGIQTILVKKKKIK
jgi:hypothetical protein